MSIEDIARAFAVQRQGRWTVSDVRRLRNRLARRRVDVTGLEIALERSRHWFFQHPAHLFVCGGEPCRARAQDSEGVFARLESHAGLAVSVTACQGPCREAPVGTLRVGERSAMFAQVHRLGDWDAVIGYATRAAMAGTLLVDPGQAQAFVFDPVHDHARASSALQPLAFLVGQFGGTGGYAERDGSFHKEVVGSWEASGRFIGLRMAVTYPLDDGRNDVHQALVLVGYNAAGGEFEARAYTDSGTTHDYRLTLDGDRVLFDDRVPPHTAGAVRARKVLAPRSGGYDESLEIQLEGQPFHTFSTVPLRATAPTPGSAASA
jgi:hypothetical protein